MRPAIRPSMKPRLAGEAVFSQLLSSLTVAHRAGVLHCDVRPSNCLKFEDGGWQVIDYDLSVLASSGQCSLQRNTNQFDCAGEDVKAKFEVAEKSRDADVIYDSKITINWTVHDDICMLFKTCAQDYMIGSSNLVDPPVTSKRGVMSRDEDGIKRSKMNLSDEIQSTTTSRKKARM